VAAAAALTALGSSQAAPPQPELQIHPRSSWVDFTTTNQPNCLSGSQIPCQAYAAAGNFEVFAGLFGGQLVELFGNGAAGYSQLFACDGRLDCAPGGAAPCCPIYVQTGTPSMQSLTVDASGNAWWINTQTHHIHYFIPGSRSDVDLDVAIGQTGYQWESVAAGATGLRGQVWGITTGGQIYALNGSIWSATGHPVANGWYSIVGAARQIAFMNETDSSTSCGSGWHHPFVYDTNGNVDEYFARDGGTDCLVGGFWNQLSSNAIGVAPNDIIVGGSNASPVLYQWRTDQFGRSGAFPALAPPLPAGRQIVNVGGQVGSSAVWVTDTSTDIWIETCGWYGC
jgi:hypothetical protein